MRLLSFPSRAFIVAGVLLVAGVSDLAAQWQFCSNGTWPCVPAATWVGIGTSSPAVPLDIAANVNNAQRIRLTNTNSGSGAFASLNLSTDAGTGAFFMNSVANTTYGGSGTLTLDNASNNAVAIATNDTVRMFVDRTGLVGIGTTVPAMSLDIATDANNAQRIRLTNANSGAGAFASLNLNTDAGTGAFFMNSVANTTYGGSGTLTLDNASNNAVAIATNDTVRMWVDKTGKVGINTTSPNYQLDVAGDVHATSVTATTIVGAVYQDVAEWVPASAAMPPGTVVVLNPDKNNEVMSSARAYDTAVAGVVSEHPGLILGQSASSKAMIATTGRVKVHATAGNGRIRVGDLLVTSDEPGTAMRSTPVEVAGVQMHRPGTLIGKALEPLASGHGDILVLLSLQ